MQLLSVCWGGQAAAWLLGQVVPLIGRQVLEAKVRARIGRLQDAKQRLREEWGMQDGG